MATKAFGASVWSPCSNRPAQEQPATKVGGRGEVGAIADPHNGGEAAFASLAEARVPHHHRANTHGHHVHRVEDLEVPAVIVRSSIHLA